MLKNLLLILLIIHPFWQQDWIIFRNDTFSLEHPADWKVLENQFVEGNFTWNSPLMGTDDNFSESINLLIQDLRGLNLSLDDYTEFSTGQIESIPGAAILRSSRLKNESGMEYQVVHYTAERSGIPLYFVQHYRLYEDQAYVLTFTAEQDQYGSFEKTAAKILSSFKLLKLGM